MRQMWNIQMEFANTTRNNGFFSQDDRTVMSRQSEYRGKAPDALSSLYETSESFMKARNTQPALFTAGENKQLDAISTLERQRFSSQQARNNWM